MVCMRMIKKNLKTIKISTVVGILSCITFSTFISPLKEGTVYASSVKQAETKVEIIGGKLDYIFPKDQLYDFGQISVSDKTPKYQQLKTQTISDTRGTGEGYNLVVSSTKFIDVNDSKKALNAGTLSVKNPTSSSFTKKTNGGDGNGIIHTGKNTIDGSSIMLLYAPRNAGMGNYDIEFDNKALEFKIIQNDAKKGTYKSIITFTLSTGPEN